MPATNGKTVTTKQGFTPAGQLKDGMHVQRADGSVGVITDWQPVTGTKTMYNLEGQQDHTFVSGTDLRGVDLTGVDLSEAILDGAIFE